MTPAEQAARMDAYYYGFARTGVEAIDRILSAVACAGKAFHHTEDWNNRVWDGTPEDKHPAPYEPFLRGWTPVEWIQNAAIDAAAALEQARREERERRDRLCKSSGYAGALMLRVFEQDDDQAAAIRPRAQESD